VQLDQEVTDQSVVLCFQQLDFKGVQWPGS
jgi:hypothetical protein